jgi:predicted DCC family thiol-disulfide oxidoreductase YuxK
VLIPILLYDGQCAFCRRWAARLARWDGAGRIAQVPMQERHAVAGIPPLSDTDLDRAMHVVLPDGRVEAGARGFVAVLPWLPGGRIFRPLFRVPGAVWLSERVYAWVARRRHRFGCGNDACPLR